MLQRVFENFSTAVISVGHKNNPGEGREEEKAFRYISPAEKIRKRLQWSAGLSVLFNYLPEC